ncbi:MAG: N-acetylneuraminate synthase family protein [Thermotaleaceae bacterium]
MVYNLIEIANTHGGSVAYLRELIKEFEEFTEGFGMKFQPFQYDEIAVPDYEWFEVYHKLYIQEDEWKELINYASLTKDIWIDLFDAYGIQIVRQNLEKIEGIKLQASVLMNRSLVEELSSLDMSEKKLIINVSGYEVPEIKERLSEIGLSIKPQEILLEVGFQDYPTELADAGISKIGELKKHFENPIVFADHVDGKSEDALWLPLIAGMIGAEMIEKHVMHAHLETKYDYFSSMTIDQYRKYIDLQRKYTSLSTQPFINSRERVYLEKSVQLPILKTDRRKGTLVSLKDFCYKRTGKKGLDTKTLEGLVGNFHILTKDKRAGEGIYLEDLKKATIATIVACRLKSTRLPKKALLPIGDLASIERCLRNALKFSHVNHTILATSSLEEDKALEQYIYRDDVVFHRGDPDDVIERYLDIARKLKIDVIIRATGDCPYLSKDICLFLLKSHFMEGADYTCSIGEAVGTSVEIINTTALERVKAYFPRAEHSEYMTWYFQNNPEYFRINRVELPGKWQRNYRLTLDYEEDLKLFNIIEKYFNENHMEYTLEELFSFLDENPEIAQINQHLTLRYRSDEELIRLLDRETKIRS